ncbi:MAG: hypothetical protein HY558_02940 [Euryarchaeota archaeon]|nr:hypothetical protein [Euryarchaeota archaeon]
MSPPSRRPGPALGAGARVADTARLYPWVRLGPGTTVGEYCIVGHPTKRAQEGADYAAGKLGEAEPRTTIGAHSILRSHTVIYSNVRTGERLRTGHGAFIRENTLLGPSCIVGTHAILDGYVKVGRNTFIQSGCYITQSTRIGSYCFLAPHVITLDNPRIVMGEGLQGITIGEGVRIGGNSTILPRVKIRDDCLIGAGSVVTQSIPRGSLAYGNPARVIRRLKRAEIEKYRKSMEGWR